MRSGQHGRMTLRKALLDLVLPIRCIGCGAGSTALCAACRPGGSPLPVRAAVVPTVAAAAYADAVRAALIAYKERGRRDLATPLAELLSGAVSKALDLQRAPPGRVVLVPVPSARSAAAARGGDHVLRLARRSAARTGLRVVPAALALTRSPRDSAALGVAERAANLDHAMAARPPVAPASALVVDDIVTTGATLGEAARALADAGWPVIGAAVVAATPRRSAGGSFVPLAVPSAPD